MKKHLVALIALPFLLSSAQAACPVGSTCESFTGQYNYTVNGGVTARQDYNRWIDNWRSLADAGIDCTGAVDATTALQAAINAAPDHSTLIAPVGCIIKISSTILIQGRVDLNLMTLQHPLNISSGANTPPQFNWVGAGAGPWINIIDSTAINIQGFFFNTTAINTFNSVINIDGDGSVGHQTPTLNMVQYNSFNMGNQTNASLKVISVSATSNSNNENYNISNNDIRCGSSKSTLRAVDGVINSASTTLTSATATFVVGDVGKRVRVSYATGILDTTIASRTNATTVVLTAAAASSQTGATVHIGAGNGTAIYQTGSNAFHTRYHGNRIDSCAVAYDMANGSFDITHYGGGFNDIGVKLTNANGNLDYYDAEHDLQAIAGIGGISVRWMRGVTDNALANGWMVSTGVGNFTLLGFKGPESAPPANFVLFALGGAASFTSIENIYTTTFAQTNFCSAGYMAFINDSFPTITTKSGYCGSNGLPTSASGLPSGAIWRNSNVLTVVP